MKKSIKCILIFLLVILIIMVSINVSFADISSQIKDLNSGSVDATSNTSVTNMGKQIVAVIQTIGIVVAVVVILILGIKYMLGSPEEKSEYKKSMFPYFIGAVLIFAASTIVNIVYNLANSLKS